MGQQAAIVFQPAMFTRGYQPAGGPLKLYQTLGSAWAGMLLSVIKQLKFL